MNPAKAMTPRSTDIANTSSESFLGTRGMEYACGFDPGFMLPLREQLAFDLDADFTLYFAADHTFVRGL